MHEVYFKNSHRIDDILQRNPRRARESIEITELLNEHFILFKCNERGRIEIEGECNLCEKGTWPFGKDRCVVSDDITIAKKWAEVAALHEKQVRKAEKEAAARGKPVW